VSNHYDFEGRVALVTGGASGIGAATVERLRDGGAAVHVFDLANGEDVRDSAQLNAAVERLYLALGAAQHGRRESIRDVAIIQAAAKQADLDPGIVEAALTDESTIRDVLADHEEAVSRYRAFGVPTIAIEGSDVGFYGPIIRHVPRGEDAGEMWDHFHWALHQPDLYELKRDRGNVRWEPIAE